MNNNFFIKSFYLHVSYESVFKTDLINEYSLYFQDMYNDCK